MNIMEVKLNKTLALNNVDSTNENISARLRRLKIQQNIFQKAIKYLYSKFLEEDSVLLLNETNINHNNHNTIYHKLKVTFIDIRNLYEEIRFLTDSSNHIKPSDIDEIRKNIVAFETKIKQFKHFIQSELDILRNEEASYKMHHTPRKNIKILDQTQNKLMIPSPVKILIESPFKYTEVQQFQEFMKSTKRFGGWNEYNHNRFIQIWNANIDNNTLLENSFGFEENSVIYENVIEDALQKISGVNRKDIILHIEWYIQYLRLYICQQNALVKWKENKRKIKKYNKSYNQKRERASTYNMVATVKTKSNNHDKNWQRNKTESGSTRSARFNEDDQSLEIENLFKTKVNGSNDEISGISDEEKSINITKPYQSTFMKPTKQWIYRCRDRNETKPTSYIDTMKKLGVPTWRIGLRNK